jgi:release factor glutamine methyltransferase
MSAAESIATLLADATRRLAETLALEKQEARIEARVLLAHALKVDHAWLIAHDRDMPAPVERDVIEDLIARRAGGEPVAYILGEREFYGRTFKVTPDALIPRPETELLVEAALERLPDARPTRILDLGTGSGCAAISIALERMDCEVLAVDVSAAALALAKENARRLGASNVRLLVSDWYAQLAMMNFDMIISNPPYIASCDPHLGNGDLLHEPRHALASGPVGLDAINAIVAGAPVHLLADGWLILEHGYDQANACRTSLNQAGLCQIFTLADLAGQTRVTGGQWPGRQ